MPAPQFGPGINDATGPPEDISTDKAMYLRDAPNPHNRFNDGVGFQYGKGVENANQLQETLEDGLGTIMEETFEMPEFEGNDWSED